MDDSNPLITSEENMMQMPEHEETKHNIYRNMYKDTTRKFSATGHLFTMWKASCFKLIWHDMAVWIFFYALLRLLEN